MLKFRIDRKSNVPMQEQIRRRVVDEIEGGVLPAGMKMPSSRTLSRELDISRNTAAGAYERLIADGYLLARPRSGIFVARYSRAALSTVSVSGTGVRADEEKWRKRLAHQNHIQSRPSLSPDWERYPFPFVDGPFDQSLFPVIEWREASRRAMARPEIEAWARDAGDSDNPELVEELRKKVLPRRGISARADDILITSGAQQALHLVCETLVNKRTVVGIENPTNPDLRHLLDRKKCPIEIFEVDQKGLCIDEERLARCDIVFVSPSRQRPTGVAMPVERRQQLFALAQKHDIMIVEDDYQWEAGFAFSDTRALRGEDGGSEVIYVASLAQPLSAAVRLGMLIAPAPVIREARAARRVTGRSPPLTLQTTFAHMLSLGLYAKALRRVETAFVSRMIALRDALNHYLPRRVSFVAPRLGATAWITGPDDLDATSFIRRAETYGALIEPVSSYFDANAPHNVFRLGVSGIPEENIRSGVAKIAQALKESLNTDELERVDKAATPLGHSDLSALCHGLTVLCRTVYQEPCTIHLKTNGAMSGHAGFASEDRDTGHWWIEDDLWCRQWNSWAYGEIAKFRVTVSGNKLHWLNKDGVIIDWGIIARTD